MSNNVSIVIPVYNEAEPLEACLQAIAEQTVKPLEVIVVDNNSTDKSREVAQKFAFVRVINEKRQGIVFARNAGFDAVQGEIIGRIDADIRLPEGWVEHVQSFYAQATNQQLAWTGAGYFYNVPLPNLVSWTYRMLAFGLNWLLIGHCTLWGSNMAVRKDHWRQVRANIHLRTDIHEDLDLAMHLRANGIGIKYDSSIKTNARMGRVLTNRGQLWSYLQWWPRTLRVHGKWSWPIVWFFGAFLLYGATYILVFTDWLKSRLSNDSLPELENSRSQWF
ncbi:MAG TPA: glycosyltransferase family A protein [Candidatus Saccharimonadales bacterium]|nr:glycosyltransferase family A protein [Candidatus Saccharimonadales bacterium]